jgi:hypothetical protein
LEGLSHSLTTSRGSTTSLGSLEPLINNIKGLNTSLGRLESLVNNIKGLNNISWKP